MKKRYIFMALVALIPAIAYAGAFNNNYKEPSYNSRAVATKTSNYTATVSDEEIRVSTSSAAVTITLPALSTLASNGYSAKSFKIMKTSSDANLVTVSPNSADTIDGTTAYVIANQNDFIIIGSDVPGSNWTIGYADDILDTNVTTGAMTAGGALTVKGALTASGTLTASSTFSLTSSITVSDTATFNGPVILGNAAADTITVTGTATVATPFTVNSSIITSGPIRSTGAIVVDKVTADPCATTGYAEGALFYNDTGNYFCYCNGTDDLQFGNYSSAPCF